MEVIEPKFYFDIVQGTDEWYALRQGRITGSVAKTFLVKGRQENGFGVGAITEMYKIVEERLTKTPRENFSTRATEWGKEYESDAIQAYELRYFRKVKECGFVVRNEWAGTSPDGIVSMDKKIGLEAKCLPTKHLQIFDTGEPEKDHVTQCQYNLWVTGFKEWHLIYFHPNLPETCNLIMFTIIPDIDMFKAFEDGEKRLIEIANKRLTKYQITEQ